MLFHVIGMKCQKCGSYNTCRTDAPENSAKNGTSEPNTSESEPSGATGDASSTPASRTGASNSTH